MLPAAPPPATLAFPAAAPPPPPSVPPTAGMPRDPGTAATAALLNLSGLGLGHLYLRRWVRALPAWLVTGALLFVALPVTADGINGLWVVLWLVVALATAADAYRLAGPAAPNRRGLWIPITAGVLLLALPAAGVVLFNDAQRQALEDDLQEVLAAADARVERVGDEPFGDAEDTYRSALGQYLGVRDDHPDTDAAGEVPDRLDALYEDATAARTGEDDCAGVVPLRFFVGLPEEFDDSEAERLAERAGGALPGPLHGCGVSQIASDPEAAGESLRELLDEHGESEQATGLPGELGDRQRTAVDGIGGDAPCASLDELRSLNTLFAGLPGAEFTQLADDGQGPIPEGLYQCGTDSFLGGSYDVADTHLNELVTDHPGHERVDHAQKVLIASQIAAEYPPAGEELPPENDGGGATVTVEVLNDSPQELEILWTGPTTGSQTVGPCDGCSVYPVDPGDSSCSSGTDYPTTTLQLPAGDYHFLHRSPGLSMRTLTETSSLNADFIYTWCSYTTEEDLLFPDLPDLPDLEGGTDA
ncbi:hypothetical protein D7319_20245 [Streptomyces radicis]|uniref:DUF1109 domain-containing protein n=2 Tax=Streptomyces radicis TaxID=1750517 RepID=A0A3A9W1C2_9ACTN|nr:hypothetical protein D7319_20245 [Streptomyces radicis]RKN15086.1 hypothetical protein D7318_28115 [Streptomyces radicis]